jgi:hypothetical protein
VTPSPAPSPAKIRAAWIIAISVDALQLGLFPITASASTWVDKPLDILAMGAIWALIGFHWALIPTFLFEFLPFAELIPTWTGAMFLMSRRWKGQPQIQDGNRPTLEG